MNSTFRTRSPLRKVSVKKAAEDKVYWKLRANFLKAHPICQFLKCLNSSVDIHHVKGRYGKNYLDVKHFKAVCRRCHQYLHDNPKVARRHGFLK